MRGHTGRYQCTDCGAVFDVAGCSDAARDASEVREDAVILRESAQALRETTQVLRETTRVNVDIMRCLRAESKASVTDSQARRRRRADAIPKPEEAIERDNA